MAQTPPPSSTSTQPNISSRASREDAARPRGWRLAGARLLDPETTLQLVAQILVFSLVTGITLGFVAMQVPFITAVFMALLLGITTLPVLRRLVLRDGNYYRRVAIMLLTVTLAATIVMELSDAVFAREYTHANWLAAWSAALFMNIVYVGLYLEHERARRNALAAEQNRMRMLQAQLNPHFVSNTLANVSALIDNDPPAAQNLLREFISFANDLVVFSRHESVVFADTLDTVETYLHIERIRIGPRLSWEIDVPDGLRWMHTIPMVTLPLVENAITHGVNRVSGPGWVKLSAHIDDALDTWVLTVANNSDRAADKKHRGHGIAIENIRERLRLKFGSAASLELYWADDHTHCARLRMPLLPPTAPPARTAKDGPPSPFPS